MLAGLTSRTFEDPWTESVISYKVFYRKQDVSPKLLQTFLFVKSRTLNTHAPSLYGIAEDTHKMVKCSSTNEISVKDWLAFKE